MINLVLQEEPTGCGFASAAMLAGRSCVEVKNIENQQGFYVTDAALFTTTDYVHRLLFDLDVSLAEVEEPFPGWDLLPDKALLATKLVQK